MTPRASGVLSVIVPVLNAEDNIPQLVRRFQAALDGGLSCDIIFVDDGSTDRTRRRLTSLHVEDLRINSTEHPQI
jgi:glycosyltransferase involved in cell wall biosynthesis